MSKVALVTGGNQGLGFALVRGLCRQLGPDAAVYLTARSPEKGEAACASLRQEGLTPEFLELDVNDAESVNRAAATVRGRHGGLDIVISNAAARIARDVPQAAQVRGFIETNNHGTRRMVSAFAPALNRHGRFLIVASGFGTLTNLHPSLHGLFDTDTASLDDIERMMDDYVAAVEAGTAAARGWPDWINLPSKIAQVASARILMRQTDTGSGIIVNAVCPGLVDTDASRPWFDDMSAAQSPDDAARDIVWLATAADTGFYGTLVQHRKEIPWR